MILGNKGSAGPKFDGMCKRSARRPEGPLYIHLPNIHGTNLDVDICLPSTEWTLSVQDLSDMAHNNGLTLLTIFVGLLHAGLDTNHAPAAGGIGELRVGIHVESPINGGPESNPREYLVTSIR